MNEFKILIEICNLTTQDTKTILLPNPSLKKILMNFGDKIPQNNLIINYSSKIDFSDSSSLSPMVLNNLLSCIDKLPDARKEKVYDLYMHSKSHRYLDLLIAYKNEYHYEVISETTANTKDILELKRRAGEVYMLGVVPDFVIFLDEKSSICDKYRDAMFREGIRAGEIIYIEGKYYIKDDFLMESLRDEDFTYIEEEENYLMKEWAR